MRIAPADSSKEPKKRRLIGHAKGRPEDVETSILLWIMVAVLSVLQQALTTFQISRHPERIIDYVTSVLANDAQTGDGESSGQLSADALREIDTYAHYVPWFTLIFWLLLVAFMLFVVYQMGQRKRWARMILNFGGAYLTVTAVFVVFGVVTGNSGAQDPLRMFFTPGAIDGGSVLDFVNICLIVLQGIIAVPGVYGMFKKDSNDWFMEGINKPQSLKKPRKPADD